jgi:hypothetical protein
VPVEPALRDPANAGAACAARRRSPPVARALLVIGLLALCAAARADPNDYVKLGAASSARTGAPAAQAAAFGVGLGLSDRWFSEAYVQFANSVGGTNGGGLDAASWENIVRFAEPGQWPVDLGAMVEIERPRAGSQGWLITAGPLLQGDFGPLQVNANVLLSRVIDGAPHEATQLAYQFQLRYRDDPRLELGMQALGGVGAWNHWGHPDGRNQRAGPALFGTHKLGKGRGVNYNAALLFGLSRAAADTTVRAQVEYEF